MGLRASRIRVAVQTARNGNTDARRRIEVLRQLAEPRSCTEVAVQFDQTPQRVYYHVKHLVDAGLATRVAERRVRGIHEGVYLASARSY